MLKTTVESLLRITTPFNKTHLLPFSSVAQLKSEERLSSFRTSETDPLKHSLEHAAQFYKIPDKDRKILFEHGGIPFTYQQQTKSFNETCIMVRQPSIDVINCLKSIDYSKPAVRFVLFGKKGTGKSLTLAHVLHYAAKDNFLLVHVPWVPNWMQKCKEYSNSVTKEGFVDTNIDAAAWLLHFKTQNAHLLDNKDLRTTAEHVWSKREITPKDAPLTELIEHGINRIKYASSCVIVLCDEIKKLTTQGVCKTLVAIDGFNAFYYGNTKVYTEKKEMVPPEKVTLTEAFLNVTKFDWKNSAVVVTVDVDAANEQDQISYFPRYLLGKKGFEHLDPFVPILVPDYSDKEFISCLEYYKERKWLQPYPGQDEELAFVSASNPYKLLKICAAL